MTLRVHLMRLEKFLPLHDYLFTFSIFQSVNIVWSTNTLQKGNSLLTGSQIVLYWLPRRECFSRAFYECAQNTFHRQLLEECIPVGCVPAARWPYAGVCVTPRGDAQKKNPPKKIPKKIQFKKIPPKKFEGCLVPGGCRVPRGSVWSHGGVFGPEGVSGPGPVWSQGGVCSGGCGIPACIEADTPLWTEWQTGVKILPWPQLRCGR